MYTYKIEILNNMNHQQTSYDFVNIHVNDAQSSQTEWKRKKRIIMTVEI